MAPTAVESPTDRIWVRNLMADTLAIPAPTGDGDIVLPPEAFACITQQMFTGFENLYPGCVHDECDPDRCPACGNQYVTPAAAHAHLRRCKRAARVPVVFVRGGS